jgi:hypothetical protein
VPKINFQLVGGGFNLFFDPSRPSSQRSRPSALSSSALRNRSRAEHSPGGVFNPASLAASACCSVASVSSKARASAFSARSS